MNSFKKMRRPLPALGKAAFTIALVALAFVGLMRFSDNIAAQQTDSIRQSVQNAVMHCYALEGSYPPSLDYLHDNYGLILDKQHYVYEYQTFASNLPPDIFIFKKK